MLQYFIGALFLLSAFTLGAFVGTIRCSAYVGAKLTLCKESLKVQERRAVQAEKRAEVLQQEIDAHVSCEQK